MAGRLYVIGVGPGDPELLTLKGARISKGCGLHLRAERKGGRDQPRPFHRQRKRSISEAKKSWRSTSPW